MAERPGLRPDEQTEIPFRRRQNAPRRQFSGSLRRVAVFGPYRSASDGQVGRRPDPWNGLGIPPGPPPRPASPQEAPDRGPASLFAQRDPAPSAPAAASDRRPSEPPVRRDQGSLPQGQAMAGWGRCIFWKMSEVRGLVARDMLTIGGWCAYSFLLTFREKGPLCDQQRGAGSDPKRTIGSYIMLGTATYRWGL